MFFLMLTQKCSLLAKHNSVLLVRYRTKWTSENVKLFADLFEMPLKDCKRYRYEQKLPALSAEQLRSAAAFCESINVSKHEWLQYPILLKQKTETLHQQYLQLKEGGFINVDANTLGHYRKCTNQKISYLKLYGIIPSDISVADNFAKYLHPQPSDLFLDDLTDKNSFGFIHHSILTRYLMWKFDTSQDTVEKFYRVYSLTKIKSFDVLCQNFSVAEELGYPPKKVLKHGYLLTTSPHHTRAVLAKIPILAGVDVRKAMKAYPKLIGLPPEHFMEIYEHLKNEQIPDETIQKCINIFYMSPTTLKARLEEIQLVPELRVLLNNPQFLKLIVHHNEARSRLSFLQQIKLKCATTKILAGDHETFSLYVRGGKDLNNINEVFLYVKRLLKTDDKNIEVNLKKHHYYRHVPLLEIERSYKFLKKNKFTNQSITTVTQVLLYPSSKLQEALKKIKECDYLRHQKIDLVEKLNLVLYFIEREHHFTGNGIWPNEEET